MYGIDTLSTDSVTVGQISTAVIAKAIPAIGHIKGMIGTSFETGATAMKMGRTRSNVVAQLKENGKIKTRSYNNWLNGGKAEFGSNLFGGNETSKYEPPLPSGTATNGRLQSSELLQD